eukprot:ctg_1359.g290
MRQGAFGQFHVHCATPTNRNLMAALDQFAGQRQPHAPRTAGDHNAQCRVIGSGAETQRSRASARGNRKGAWAGQRQAYKGVHTKSEEVANSWAAAAERSDDASRQKVEAAFVKPLPELVDVQQRSKRKQSGCCPSDRASERTSPSRAVA